jgi:hypothetical protein
VVTSARIFVCYDADHFDPSALVGPWGWGIEARQKMPAGFPKVGWQSVPFLFIGGVIRLQNLVFAGFALISGSISPVVSS